MPPAPTTLAQPWTLPEGFLTQRVPVGRIVYVPHLPHCPRDTLPSIPAGPVHHIENIHRTTWTKLPGTPVFCQGLNHGFHTSWLCDLR